MASEQEQNTKELPSIGFVKNIALFIAITPFFLAGIRVFVASDGDPTTFKVIAKNLDIPSILLAPFTFSFPSALLGMTMVAAFLAYRVSTEGSMKIPVLYWIAIFSLMAIAILMSSVWVFLLVVLPSLFFLLAYLLPRGPVKKITDARLSNAKKSTPILVVSAIAMVSLHIRRRHVAPRRENSHLFRPKRQHGIRPQGR